MTIYNDALMSEFLKIVRRKYFLNYSLQNELCYLNKMYNKNKKVKYVSGNNCMDDVCICYITRVDYFLFSTFSSILL